MKIRLALTLNYSKFERATLYKLTQLRKFCPEIGSKFTKIE